MHASPPRPAPKAPRIETRTRSTPPDRDARVRAAQNMQTIETLIDRVLSGDSRAFLDANRQTGGQ